ncbi:MAG: histidinol-phosphate transaminase, partial [Lachnospiraceae bacterium]|nr:histidinol-phosphate transaminase [Lachnospiraceae bacterium]
HKTIPAKEIFEALKKEGIFVRYFNKPRIDNHLRITIGTDDEMDKLITFLKEFTAC